MQKGRSSPLNLSLTGRNYGNEMVASQVTSSFVSSVTRLEHIGEADVADTQSANLNHRKNKQARKVLV